MHPGITAVAVWFWIFLAVVCVAGIISDYYKRQLALEPLRLAIQHGQQLSPEMIAKLLGREQHPEEPLDPQLLRVGGIITSASGLGVALLSIFVSLAFPPYHWIALGVGILAVCVGIGLLMAAASLQRHATNNPRDNMA